MSPWETRLWATLTEERLQRVIGGVLSSVWPTTTFLTIIKERTMSDNNSGRHSDPYPKMPWQSSGAEGRHRSDARRGCAFSPISVTPVIALILVVVVMVWR
jgi:hypothetical protein